MNWGKEGGVACVWSELLYKVGCLGRCVAGKGRVSEGGGREEGGRRGSSVLVRRCMCQI